MASSSSDARSNTPLVLRPFAAISSSNERENAFGSAAWWMRPFHTMRSRRRWISRARTGTSSRRGENTVSPDQSTAALGSASVPNASSTGANATVVQPGPA